MDWLFDERTECWSVQTKMSVEDYISLIAEAHQSQGSLSGQRDVLSTTTAKRIRARMVEDLKLGAVLPPIVIGAVIEGAAFSKFPLLNATTVDDILPPAENRILSIIDGMQRTAAILEAAAEDSGVLARDLRVELWLASNVRPMIYRMLVLNTGQVPWTMSRQLTVVFAPLLDEVLKSVPELEKVATPDQPGRRVRAAQYSSDAIVELYIAFSLRKTLVDTKEAVSDEFSRLDFVENLSETEFQDQFYRTLAMMARLDKSVSRFETGSKDRFSKGRNIFDSQPARIGFVVATGLHILGRPGADRTPAERIGRIDSLEASATMLNDRLDLMTLKELGDFLRLDVLQEVLDRRVGQVGRYERAVFGEAFKVLVGENFQLENLEQCWRAN